MLEWDEESIAGLSSARGNVVYSRIAFDLLACAFAAKRTSLSVHVLEFEPLCQKSFSATNGDIAFSSTSIGVRNSAPLCAMTFTNEIL